ncbi:hypothetical protein CVT26_008633 [Gymnopilus dilepis]|uniref:Uncharacterized protein n=1 Tax=Gymnopilus dilepis TaxID=231916 RepID=A0A409XXZ8_9AGAR|nr:hypothetical protein CVT26_008633 [Gymnopilus dilepis]
MPGLHVEVDAGLRCKMYAKGRISLAILQQSKVKGEGWQNVSLHSITTRCRLQGASASLQQRGGIHSNIMFLPAPPYPSVPTKLELGGTSLEAA